MTIPLAQSKHRLVAFQSGETELKSRIANKSNLFWHVPIMKECKDETPSGRYL